MNYFPKGPPLDDLKIQKSNPLFWLIEFKASVGESFLPHTALSMKRCSVRVSCMIALRLELLSLQEALLPFFLELCLPADLHDLRLEGYVFLLQFPPSLRSWTYCSSL